MYFLATIALADFLLTDIITMSHNPTRNRYLTWAGDIHKSSIEIPLRRGKHAALKRVYPTNLHFVLPVPIKMRTPKCEI